MLDILHEKCRGARVVCVCDLPHLKLQCLNMISSLFNALVHTPLYNALVYIISVVPHADVGLAVIALTVLVKLILFPLARRASLTQARVRAITPQIEELKERYKDDKQTQTLEIIKLYKENGIKMSTSFLVMLIQLPVILGLYWIFYKGGLPTIDTSILYSFMPALDTDTINMQFLGIIDMAGRSLSIAILAGLSQFFYSTLVMPKPKPRGENPTLKEDLAHSMHLQMKFVMPIVIAGVAYFISAAVALYWATSNIFMILQELIVQREHKRSTIQTNQQSV